MLEPNGLFGPRTGIGCRWLQNKKKKTLQWRHNGHDSVSNHQPHDCLLNRLFRRRSKKTSKLRVTGLCEGNSPGTGEFPAQMASNAENVSIRWRHHVSWARLVKLLPREWHRTPSMIGSHWFRQWLGVVQSRIKPLPEPMLTNIYVDIWSHWAKMSWPFLCRPL